MVFFEFMFFHLWMMAFVFLFVIFLFIFWIWAMIDCLRSNLSRAQKLFWIIIIIFFNLIGVLLYFIFAKSMVGKSMKTKNLRGKILFRSKYKRVGSFGAEEEDEFKAILKILAGS